MSLIYFHSLEDKAQVRGIERYQARAYVNSLFEAALEIPECIDQDNPFLNFIPEICSSLRDPSFFVPANWSKFVTFVKLWLHENGNYFQVGDRKVNIFSTQLNTAYVMGNDPIKLMARLHGQCEDYCYVEPKNCKWLAGIIEEGLGKGIYRQRTGWDNAIALLRDGCNSPVVTSYSICHAFPNPIIANFEPIEEDWESWYQLSKAQRWDLGIAAIRNNSASLELTPENWDSFRFGDGCDAFKLNYLLTIPPSDWNAIASKLVKK